MTDQGEHIERLLSESSDRESTAARSAELDRILTVDPEAARAARQYARLNELLAGWRALPAELDWARFTRSTGAAISEAAVEDVPDHRDPQPVASEPTDASVDHLVRGSAGPLPEVDWAALKSRISERVRQEAASPVRRQAAPPLRWRRSARWLGRIGVPLAAAAAIVLVVWWPKGDQPPGSADRNTVAPWVVMSLDIPKRGGHVSVSFEEAPSGVPAEGQPIRGGVAIAIAPVSSADSDLFDEALFY